MLSRESVGNVSSRHGGSCQYVDSMSQQNLFMVQSLYFHHDRFLRVCMWSIVGWGT